MSTTTHHPAIRPLEKLLEWRRGLRERGQRLVQCHGCFDIVHPGHIRHLRWARAQGDALLVTITADQGVNKGVGRPLIPHDLRAENLASLDMVDAVHVVEAPTAEGILRAVQPDVYVKGREYQSNEDPRFAAEREAVEAHGGRVVFSSGDIVFSSSALIAAIEGGRDTGVDASTGTLAQLLRQPGLRDEGIARALEAARGRRVLVLGESVEEVYRVCQAPQMASREPVMTLRPAGERRFDGGAAGVAIQLAAMGLRPLLVTAPPAGKPGELLAERLRGSRVALSPLPPIAEPMVIEHFVAGVQKLMTVDHARSMATDRALPEAVASVVADRASGADAVCVADQGLGLLAGPVARKLSELLKERRCVLTTSAQARSANPLSIRHADLLYAAEADLHRAVGNPSGSLTASAWSAMDAAQAGAALVGLGAEGLLAFDRLDEAIDSGDGWPTRVRAQPVPSLAPLSLDSCGANAAALAAATAGLVGARAAGLEPDVHVCVAAVLAAVAEADAISRPGMALVTHGSMRTAVDRLSRAHLVFRPDASQAPARVAS